MIICFGLLEGRGQGSRFFGIKVGLKFVKEATIALVVLVFEHGKSAKIFPWQGCRLNYGRGNEKRGVSKQKLLFTL